jgi:hypothetical protein
MLVVVLVLLLDLTGFDYDYENDDDDDALWVRGIPTTGRLQAPLDVPVGKGLSSSASPGEATVAYPGPSRP